MEEVGHLEHRIRRTHEVEVSKCRSVKLSNFQEDGERAVKFDKNVPSRLPLPTLPRLLREIGLLRVNQYWTHAGPGRITRQRKRRTGELWRDLPVQLVQTTLRLGYDQ